MSAELVGIAGFARSLTHAGLPVATDSVELFTRALREIDLADMTQVYWTAQATLCRDPDDLPRFDLAFEAWFGDRMPRATRRPAQPRQSRVAALRSADAQETSGAGPALAVAADSVAMSRCRRVVRHSAAPPHDVARWTGGRPSATCSPRAANRCARAGTDARRARAGWCCCSMCPDR